jgi:hypothetical protein
MCHPDWTGIYLSQTENAAIELVTYLFKKYDKLTDPQTQIITHKQTVGWKICPRWYSEMPQELQRFKDAVDAGLKPA